MKVKSRQYAHRLHRDVPQGGQCSFGQLETLNTLSYSSVLKRLITEDCDRLDNSKTMSQEHVDQTHQTKCYSWMLLGKMCCSYVL